MKSALDTISELAKLNYVHGKIDESVFYKDNQGRLVIGKLVSSLRLSNELSDKAKDIFDVAQVVHRRLNGVISDPLMADLLDEMLDSDPIERPTPAEALDHPLFWDAERKINLYFQASDFLRSDRAKKCRKQFDSCRAEIINGNWKKYVSKELVEEASGHNQLGYSGESTCDLVRLIRNKWAHRPNEKLVTDFPMKPKDFFDYFDQRFPTLFLYTYYFYDKFH